MLLDPILMILKCEFFTHFFNKHDPKLVKNSHFNIVRLFVTSQQLCVLFLPVLRTADLQLPDAPGRLHQSQPGAAPRPAVLQATAVSRLSSRPHVPPLHPRPRSPQSRVGDVPLRLALDHDHPRENGSRKTLLFKHAFSL